MVRRRRTTTVPSAIVERCPWVGWPLADDRSQCSRAVLYPGYGYRHMIRQPFTARGRRRTGVRDSAFP